MSTKPVFYFGPINEAGHYLWSDERSHIWNHAAVGIHKNLFHALDGAFCPPVDQVTGIVQKNQVGPWLILSWWDRSQDTRGACNSNILGKGFESVAELIESAQKQFPAVFARQKTPLTFPA